MNIYEKIQALRVSINNKKIKKSGKNKFAGYEYYELSDFIPATQEEMKALGICAYISFDASVGTMTIVNSENVEEKIIITTPMASAALKGCHDVQNLGAVHTYLRRYLYILMLELCEPDDLDRSEPLKNNAPSHKNLAIGGEDICPQCGKILVERNGKSGKFIACPGFPVCKFTKAIKQQNLPPKPNSSVSGGVLNTQNILPPDTEGHITESKIFFDDDIPF